MTRCIKCAACCRQMIVEAYHEDVVREPRLMEAVSNGHNQIDGRPLSLRHVEGGRCLVLSALTPCPFLGADHLCTIYPTRPDACSAFRPGSPKCVSARRRSEGRPPAGEGDQ